MADFRFNYPVMQGIIENVTTELGHFNSVRADVDSIISGFADGRLLGAVQTEYASLHAQLQGDYDAFAALLQLLHDVGQAAYDYSYQRDQQLASELAGQLSASRI